MFDQISQFISQPIGENGTLMVIGVALGALLIFAGVASAMRDRNPAAGRMTRNLARAEARQNRGLLHSADSDPSGLLKKFVPSEGSKRNELRLKLAQAGFAGPRAVWSFTLARVLIGGLLPGIFLGLAVASRTPGLDVPAIISSRIVQLNSLQVLIVLGALAGIGFFVPLSWLNDKIKERRLRINEGFPNALDLMQVSVEAGLGFDAAMTRVGNELAEISPDIAFEFLSVQRQVQAGRAREEAMRDMADRTGVEVVRSFANVVRQSMQLGTSMSEALETYAEEMREMRETKAQEMANKLPVKMSAVLATLMLPALIMLTVGPVVIRYIRYFAS